MKPKLHARWLSRKERQQVTFIAGQDHHEEMAKIIQRHLKKQFANAEKIIAAQNCETASRRL